MKNTEFLFASSAVKSLENSLLPQSFFEQIINAPDFDSAKKILIDKGFTGFEKSELPEIALAGFKKAVYDEVSSILGDKKSVLDFAVIRNDFQNLKASIKALLAGLEEISFSEPSLFDAKAIYKEVKSKNFDLLPYPLSKYAKEAWDIASTTLNGQKTELFLDRACLEESLKMAENSGNEWCASYARLENTLTDIKSVIRAVNTDALPETLSFALTSNSDLPTDVILSAYLKKGDVLNSALNSVLPEGLREYLSSDVSVFEKKCDDLLIEKLSDARLCPFGAEIAVSYYFEKMFEYKNLCTVYSFKKAGFDADTIKERMRAVI